MTTQLVEAAEQTTESLAVLEDRRAPPRNWRGQRRKGKKGVLVYVDPKLAVDPKPARQLALDEDSTVQALGHEALEYLLAQRGRDA